MIKIDYKIKPEDLMPKIDFLFHTAAKKIRNMKKTWDLSKGSPVYTKGGIYQSKGWTDWTKGFQYGMPLLLYDATGETEFLELGKKGTIEHMPPDVTNMGVHDHGFNIVSTYGSLLRLIRENRFKHNQWERNYYELALRCSGAVQARRWTKIHSGGGYIYSFNGPHSLFIDTIRTLRVLGLAYKLGQTLLGEHDEKINLLERLIFHLMTSAKYSVYYGDGRDSYDVRGRVAHEVIFNIENGIYRCPNSQQGYSPFSTWTRGLAWAILGFAEQLEFIEALNADELKKCGGKKTITKMMYKASEAVSDYYIQSSPADGVPYWDTGAPMLHKIDDYLNNPADPFNSYEPVDSSAALIAAQGLLRMGHLLGYKRDNEKGKHYWQAALTILNTVFDKPYVSTHEDHQGLIIHSVYHRPNGWDYIPPGAKIPYGESSMWGDYHGLEAAVYLQRIINGDSYLQFWKE
jgi:unsaturated chondroitin disaccharide hydrolase